MNKFAFAAAVAGVALFASTSAFASKAGGADTMNPVVKEGVAVSQDAAVQVWAGSTLEVQPTVTVDALTGTASDPSETVHVGRLTWRVPTLNAANASQFAYIGRPYILG